MRRALSWAFGLSVLLFAAYSVREAMRAAPPTPEEAWVAFGEEGPDPGDGEEPSLTERKRIRGWNVWLGNFPRHYRGSDGLFAERVDPQNPFRQVRLFRAPRSLGAKLRSFWITITGNRP